MVPMPWPFPKRAASVLHICAASVRSRLKGVHDTEKIGLTALFALGIQNKEKSLIRHLPTSLFHALPPVIKPCLRAVNSN